MTAKINVQAFKEKTGSTQNPRPSIYTSCKLFYFPIHHDISFKSKLVFSKVLIKTNYRSITFRVLETNPSTTYA